MNAALKRLQEKLHILIHTVAASAGVPGIGLSVRIEGQRLEVFAGRSRVGQADHLASESRFPLGCLVKCLVASSIADLAEKGILDLAAPVSEFVRGMSNKAISDPLRIVHLVSHTAGYGGLEGVIDAGGIPSDWDSWLQGFINSEQRFRPGAVFSYEHFSFALLGQLLVDIQGQPLDQALSRQLGVSPMGAYCDDKNETSGHVWNSGTAAYVPLECASPNSTPWEAASSAQAVSLGALVDLFRTAVRRPFSASLSRCCTLESDSALTVALGDPVVVIPQFVGTKSRQQLPIAYGLGVSGFRDGLVGIDSKTEGVVSTVRHDRARDFTVALSMNAPMTLLRYRILEAVVSAIRGPPKVTGPRLPAAYGDLRAWAGAYYVHAACVLRVEAPSSTELRLYVSTPTQTHCIAEVSYDPRGGTADFTGQIQQPFALFREPETEHPCIMLGLRALKKARIQ